MIFSKPISGGLIFCICSLWVFFLFPSCLVHTLFTVGLVGVAGGSEGGAKKV
jgi:hypothetical protein